MNNPLQPISIDFADYRISPAQKKPAMAIRTLFTGIAAEAPEILKGEVGFVLVGAAATACVDVKLTAKGGSVAVLRLAPVATVEGRSVPVLPLAAVAVAEAVSPETVTYSHSVIYLLILWSKTHDGRRQVVAGTNAKRFKVYAGLAQRCLANCFTAHSPSKTTSTLPSSANVGIASSAQLPHVSTAATFAWVHKQVVVPHVCRCGPLAIVRQ